MARVSIVVTARDRTERAFRAINARARAMGRSLAAAGSSGSASFRSMFSSVRGGFARARTHVAGMFGSIRRGFSSSGGHVRSFFTSMRIHAASTGRFIGRHLRRGFMGLGRGIRSAFGSVWRIIRSSMRGGFITGTVGGFRAAMASPVVIAAAATLAMVVAGYLATALAGLLVFAFGAAFVGLGGFIASKSKVVKDAWTKMTDDVKASWKDAGKALEPVITHGIGLMHKLADAFLPHFKEAMQHAAGPVQDFLDHIADGIKQFGKRAFKPMMDGFDAFLLAFGPQLDDWFLVLGDSFKALGNTVKTHSGEVAMAVRGILNIVTWLIDTVNFLTQAWVMMMRVGTASFGYIIKAVGLLVQAIFFLVNNTLGRLLGVLAHLPGIGHYFKTAQKAIKEFGDSTASKLNEMGDEAINWGKNMDKANKKRTLKVDIKGWQADLKAAKADLKNTLSKKAVKKLQMQIKEWTDKLSKARADLKKTTSTKAKAKLEGTIADLEAKIKRAKTLLSQQSHRKSKSAIKADISDLQKKIKAARGQLNSLNGKTAKTYVVTYYSQVRNKGYNGNSATGGHAYGGIIGGMAHGGLSAATAGARGVLVGEQGPEFVQLPTGSRVRPAGWTRQAMGDRGPQRTPTLRLEAGTSDIDRLLLTILRHAIRNEGGDVQLVLGTGR